MGVEDANEEDIFRRAIQFENRDEQAEYLKKACGDNVELREAVEALLHHHYAGSILDAPLFEAGLLEGGTTVTEAPGAVIGRYKLLEKIGEGGMAVVYMAEQQEPVRRKVALKIIKLGMDTRQVIARFEAERQALAMMDHPNISKVLDAGTTETGRPYFVMELVRGTSITDYCDANNLNTNERLDLFIDVCSAVQHAHQKGIIHRDIKPSNVMVALHGGKPVPKVIDFGIAKATNQRLTEKTLFTRYSQMIGTPAYMSPEQAELSDLDIDTRSDIYSLGVLLYELLTGTTPFSEEELRRAGYLEMQRIIAKQEPTKPSTKLSTLGDTLTDVAKRRNSTPDLLRKTIRGDLDWIVMKALEKQRQRRYDTASELSADIERHLHHEPVQAAAPSLSYRVRKFVRRNRALVAGVSAVLVVFLVGFVVSTSLYLEATRSHRQEAAARTEADRLRSEEAIQRRNAEAERDKARQAEMLAEQHRNGALAARDEAERQAKISEAMVTFLKSATVLDAPASGVSGMDLEHLAGSRSLRSLSVPDTRIKDADLVHLKDMVSLEGLFLAKTQITDAGLVNLKDLTSLRSLCIENNRVGDAGLTFLKDLHSLEYLCLANTKVTDAGLGCLGGLASLRDLRLPGTQVTKAGVVELKRLLPNCRITGPDGSAVYTPPDARVGGQLPERKQLVAAGWKASWSPDGNRMVFGGRGQKGLEILDIQSGQTTDITSSGKDPAWSPDGRFIAYVDRVDPNAPEEVWLVTSTGESPRKLTEGGFPSWSADGKTLYVHSRKENKIFALATDNPGAEPQVFFDHPLSHYPAISPDGARIAFGVNDTLTIVDRQSGKPILMRPTPGHRGLLPAWSPDGRLLAFGGFVSEPFGVWVLKVASGEAVQVADGPFTMPAWSPDGAKLAFDLRSEDARQIWMIQSELIQGRKPSDVEAAGTMPASSPRVKEGVSAGAKQLIAAGSKASWSPDGKRMVFGKPDQKGLQILEVATGKVTDLTSSGKDPAWSPDGRFIAYVQGKGATDETWLVELPGGSPRKFIDAGFPSWSPDGKTLYVHSRTQNRILAITIDDPPAQPEVFLESPGAWFPAISPDGKLIALGRKGALVIVDRSGRQVLVWPTPGLGGLLPAWSPDGRYVGFGGFDNQPFGVWVLDVGARTAVQVAGGRFTMPAWSRDGTKLAFDLRSENVREIWAVQTADIQGPKITAAEAARLRPPPPAPPTSDRGQDARDTSPLITKQAPSFTLHDPNGKQVSLSDFKGKVVLLDFWATWCPPCVKAIPHLEKLYTAYKDKGLVVIGLNNESDHEKVRQFIQGRISYTVLLDANRQFDEYGIKGIPTLFYIDAEANVRYRDVGFSEGGESEIEAKVRELLGLGSQGDEGRQSQALNASEPNAAAATGLPDGNPCFSDRTCSWTRTPATLRDAEYVRTFNSDKKSTKVTYTVTTTREARLPAGTFWLGLIDDVRFDSGAEGTPM